MKYAIAILMGAICVSNSLAYYQTQQGRWMSRDPIEEKGGTHLYAYSLNNPVNRLDPFGLSDCAATVRAGHYTDKHKDDYGYDREGNLSHSEGNYDEFFCYAGCGMNELNNGLTDYHDNPNKVGDPTFTDGHEDVFDISSAIDAAEAAAVQQICEQKDENGCPECESATIDYDCDPRISDSRCSAGSKTQSCGN